MAQTDVDGPVPPTSAHPRRRRSDLEGTAADLPPLVPAVASKREWQRTYVLGLVVLSAIAAPVIAQVWGPDAAYWATPARISEILFGALVADVLLLP